MTPKSDKVAVVPADKRIQTGRLDKALQFHNVADAARELSEDDEVADAAVTLYVHAGIAAAALLATVDKKLADHLRTLLGMKTRAGYGHDPISLENLKKAQRAATQLVEAANRNI